MKSVSREKKGIYNPRHKKYYQIYYQIYEQIYERPDISVFHKGVNTSTAEDAVVGLLEEMYGDHVLFPLHLTAKSAEKYAACPQLRSRVNW